MREPGTAIRKSYYNAISAVVSSPVVDGKVEGLGGGDTYVILGEQSESDRTNKARFAHEATIQVVIVSKKKSTAGRTAVENISDDILSAIIPAPGSHGLTIEAPFHITFVKQDFGQASRVSQDIANDFENIKILQFINRITQ